MHVDFFLGVSLTSMYVKRFLSDDQTFYKETKKDSELEVKMQV